MEENKLNVLTLDGPTEEDPTTYGLILTDKMLNEARARLVEEHGVHVAVDDDNVETWWPNVKEFENGWSHSYHVVDENGRETWDLIEPWLTVLGSNGDINDANGGPRCVYVRRLALAPGERLDNKWSSD